MWPKYLLKIKEKLRSIEKLTTTNTFGASDESHRLKLIVIVREVLHIWTEEVAIKPTKTTLFKQLTSLMTLLTAFSEDP